MPEEIEVRPSDSRYIHIKIADAQQAKTAVRNRLDSLGVGVTRLRRFLCTEVDDCEVDGETVRCTFSSLPVQTTVGWLLEIDKRIDARYWEKLEQLCASEPKADYLTKADAQALPKPGDE